MADGYLITLDGDTQIEALPNDTGNLAFDIGETKVSISSWRIVITGSVPSSVSIAAQKVSEPNANTKTTNAIDARGRKKCIDCEGKRYCATNGCINTPCGWLCG